jgi:type IV pilus assembly protein PilW
MKNTINTKWLGRQIGRVSGFSLVEIMVGMVVGFVTIIVIMQSFTAFEGQKRTTTTGSDAQENGLLAFQAIESDARKAGYGLLTPKGLACTSVIYYESGVTAAPTTAAIAPVAVVDGGTGSDQVVFTAATSPNAGMPSKLNTDMPTALSNPDLDNTIGFTADQDMFLVAAPIPSPGIGAAEIPCARLPYASAVVSTYETVDPALELQMFPTAGYPGSNGFVINIGRYQDSRNGAAGFLRTRYRVNASNELVMEDVSHISFAQSAVVIASNIVNMKVQYGVAPSNTQPGAASPAINCWTDATGTGCNPTNGGNWASPNAADIMRIKAIRVAVVARSSLMEKAASGVGQTATCNATVTAPIVWASGPAVDLSADANWQCYRYRVYQTIIPLRNVIWANI